jgi:hypothetical protein
MGLYVCHLINVIHILFKFEIHCLIINYPLLSIISAGILSKTPLRIISGWSHEKVLEVNLELLITKRPSHFRFQEDKWKGSSLVIRKVFICAEECPLSAEMDCRTVQKGQKHFSWSAELCLIYSHAWVPSSSAPYTTFRVTMRSAQSKL